MLRVKKVDVTPIAEMMAVKLENMGTMKWQEIVTAIVMGTTVVFWILGSRVNIAAASVSIFATMVLVSLGVLTWNECLEEKQVIL